MKRDRLIVHIVTRLYLGGAQRVVLDVLSFLKDDGSDVLLITGRREEMTEQFENKNIPICEIKELDRHLNLINDTVAMGKIAMKLRSLKTEYDEVIVHTHTSKAGLLGRVGARIAGISEIYHTAHGWSFYEKQNTFIRKVFSLSEVLTAKFTKQIICVSKSVADLGAEAGIDKKKLTLIYNDVSEIKKISEREKEQIKSRLGILKEEKVVVQVSCLKKQKSPLDFIKTAELLKNEKIKFILAGDGELRMEIEKYVKKNDLKNVILTGWHKEIWELYNIADVFTLTSVFEGYPLAVLEYMQFNKPMVLSDIHPNREIMQKSCEYCNLHDVECFGEKVKECTLIQSKDYIYNKNKRMVVQYRDIYSQKAKKNIIKSFCQR